MSAQIAGADPVADTSVAASDAESAAVDTQSIAVAPGTEADIASASALATLTPAQAQALKAKQLHLREEIAAQEAQASPQVTSSAGVSAAEQLAGTTQQTAAATGDSQVFPIVPSAFVIGRNSKNTVASLRANTLAEIAGANDGLYAFESGNANGSGSNFTFFSRTLDGGASWQEIAVPVGPSDAPFRLGDTDVVNDHARGVTFVSALYTNGNLNAGVVRVFIFRFLNTSFSCFYDLRPLGSGVLPDYPHIGLTDDNFFLTSNNLRGNSWIGSSMLRLNADQMANCVTAGGNTLNWTGSVGQRIFTPGQGTHETMYWSSIEGTNSVRLFTWPDTTTAVTSVVRAVPTSNFVPSPGPSCQGGTGNNNYTGRLAATIQGFNVRTTRADDEVFVYYNVGADSGHLQAFARGLDFRRSDLTLIKVPDIFNQSFCFAFPDVTTNSNGDLGLSIALGGRAGGGSGCGLGCSAAQAGVGISDDFTGGHGLFGTVFIVATGTHNRADGRYGDYHVVHPHTSCDLAFEASNYALVNGNTSSANVNARYVEFVRGRNQNCYNGWRNAIRSP